MKITIVSKPTYSEEGQPNPMRWLILSGTPSKGFTNESSWLKCKDFFNDYIVAYNGGARFGIYGFSTQGMNIPEKGKPVYIAVNNLTTAFKHNIDVVNKWLKAGKKPELKLLDASEVVIEFDEYYLRSTYNISLISLVIRLCNVDTKFDSFDALCAFKSFAPKDQAKWDKVVSKKVFFDIPDKLKKYLWYYGDSSNSDKDVPVYQLSDLVHNCGVLTYSNYF